MAVSILRSIYINSYAKVTPEDGADIPTPAAKAPALPGAGQEWKAVQSANFSLNIPRADVNAFGVDGVIDRPQLEAETATMEINWVAQKQTGPGVAPPDVVGTHLMAMIGQCKAQIPRYVVVLAEGVGAVKHALMNSLSGEASVGALTTLTASFTGANDDITNIQAVENPILVGGVPVFNAPEGGTAVAPASHTWQAGAGASSHVSVLASAWVHEALVGPQDIILYDTAPAPEGGTATQALIDEALEPNVGGAFDSEGEAVGPTMIDGPPAGSPDADDVNEACAQSASFSWDMPVELILCLGANPATDGLALGNPPGSSSVTVEALSAQLSHKSMRADYYMGLGTYKIGLMGAAIDSRTHNLAVGDIHGTYNYVLGSTGDSFQIGIH
jgi:hypothetical protein